MQSERGHTIHSERVDCGWVHCERELALSDGALRIAKKKGERARGREGATISLAN